jgi:hypothetical protein
MLTHEDLGPLPVCGLEGLQYLTVVVIRDGTLVRRVPEESLEHERHLDGAPDELPQPPVTAGRDDCPVEFLVGRHEPPALLPTIGEAHGRDGLHSLDHIAQPREFLLPDPLRGSPGGMALQHGPQIVDVPDVLDGEGADHSTLVGRDLDEPLRLEHGQSLPDRGPAYPEPLRELALD